MKKLVVLNLVIVLGLLLGTVALAQEGDLGVVQRTAETYLGDWSPVISADALYENLNDGDTSNDPLIVSVRAPADYEQGHIPGAINIPWKEIAKPESLAQLPSDQPIVAYCYTGHTGQVATTILKSLGYNVQNLKFGMMGWTKNDDVLNTSRFGPETDQRDYPLQIEPNEASETYDYPTLDTGADDATEINRVAADVYLSSVGKPVISADALFDNLNDGDTGNDPYIVSVRGANHYALGHIAGAINIPWRQIANVESLAMLPTDQQIVVYCYTGHTGQVAATVLSMLGYDAVNLKFGMMGWTEDDEVLATSRFDAASQPDYAVEGGAVTSAEGAAPDSLPVTGGTPFPVEGLLAGLGAFAAAAGMYLRRRRTT